MAFDELINGLLTAEDVSRGTHGAGPVCHGTCIIVYTLAAVRAMKATGCKV